jgi:hypothetical protein
MLRARTSPGMVCCAVETELCLAALRKES